jgi:hypothetical protein
VAGPDSDGEGGGGGGEYGGGGEAVIAPLKRLCALLRDGASAYSAAAATAIGLLALPLSYHVIRSLLRADRQLAEALRSLALRTDALCLAGGDPSADDRRGASGGGASTFGELAAPRRALGAAELVTVRLALGGARGALLDAARRISSVPGLPHPSESRPAPAPPAPAARPALEALALAPAPRFLPVHVLRPDGEERVDAARVRGAAAAAADVAAAERAAAAAAAAACRLSASLARSVVEELAEHRDALLQMASDVASASARAHHAPGAEPPAAPASGSYAYAHYARARASCISTWVEAHYGDGAGFAA